MDMKNVCYCVHCAKSDSQGKMSVFVEQSKKMKEE